ncbi:MAG: class IV adenylate cyclase [Planctomycetaceae bacterium]|nr:class IV adenylate cyclase [Planctomycetaceae bacterium]
MKFRVTNIDLFESQLNELGVEFESEAVEEIDTFFSHPQRDFNLTDECLRLRQRKFVDKHEENFLTYKGPKIDKETKTRRELEIKIEEINTLESILNALGFLPVDSVRKFRRHGVINVDNTSIELLLDFIPELYDSPTGSHFVEIETIATEKNLEIKRQLILSLAKELNLVESIRTSYLGLLRQQRQ